MSIRLLSALSMSGVVTAVFVAFASCTQPAEVIEVPATVEVPVEVTREVPVTVQVDREVLATREVPVTVEVERRVVSEVEVPVIVQVPVTVEVERMATREVEVTREIEVAVTREVYLTREVPVTVEVEITREIEVEVPVTVEVDVTREVEVEVTREVDVEVPVTVEVPATLLVEVKREVEPAINASSDAIKACSMWLETEDIGEIWAWIWDFDAIDAGDPPDTKVLRPKATMDLFRVNRNLVYYLWDRIAAEDQWLDLVYDAVASGERLLTDHCLKVVEQ